IAQLLPALYPAGGSELPGTFKRHAIFQLFRSLLVGGFVEIKGGFVVLPRLCLHPFLKERFGGFRGGQKGRKNKQKCEGCCNLPHTLLLISAFPLSPSFFRGKRGISRCLTRNLDLFRMPDYTPDLMHYQNVF